MLAACGNNSESQKINFSSKDLNGVIATNLSVPESWGRWTDGTPLKLNFEKGLPNDFQLNIKIVNIMAGNIGKEFVVSIGDQKATFVTGQNPGIITLYFKDVPTGVKEIQISIPSPTQPVPNARYLGIGLEYIEIIPKS